MKFQTLHLKESNYGSMQKISPAALRFAKKKTENQRKDRSGKN